MVALRAIGRSIRFIWDRLADISLAKDIAILVVGGAALSTMLGAILVRLFTPLSTIDTVMVAALCGIIAFAVLSRYVPRTRHIHHLPIQAQTAPVASLQMTVKPAESPPPPAMEIMNSGAYIGGDNSGTQQVFHGPVTIGVVPDLANEGPPREFVPKELTALKLMAIFEGQTSLKATRQVEPYRGKWLPVTGKVLNVSGGKYDISIMMKLATDYYVLAHLPVEKEFQVAHYNRGDDISLTGKIRQISTDFIELDECEI